MSDNKRKIKLLMCVDLMSCMEFDNDADQEYDSIEKEFREKFIDFDFEFQRNIYPHKLDNESFDIYLFDYGGMLPGSESLTISLVKEFIKQAEDHPNSLFIIYSRFTSNWYKELIDEDNLTIQHNVILHDVDDDYKNKIKQWFEYR